MDLFELPPLFILLVLAVVVFIIVSAKMSGHCRPNRGAMHICRACGASHPGFARFCRKCGRQL